jgi:hypothetical protein
MGDTFVTTLAAAAALRGPRFSPLPMGDTFVTNQLESRDRRAFRFQSPSHGGHLRDCSINHTPYRYLAQQICTDSSRIGFLLKTMADPRSFRYQMSAQ